MRIPPAIEEQAAEYARLAARSVFQTEGHPPVLPLTEDELAMVIEAVLTRLLKFAPERKAV